MIELRLYMVQLTQVQHWFNHLLGSLDGLERVNTRLVNFWSFLNHSKSKKNTKV